MSKEVHIVTSKSISKYARLMEMSETPIDHYSYPSSVYIGKSKIYKLPVMLNLESMMNPHVSILGTTGSGKTHLAKNIIIGYVLKNHVNILVIDWNGEYEGVSRFLFGKTYKIGEDSGINLFRQCKGQDKRISIQILSDIAGLKDEHKNVISKITEGAKCKIDASYLLSEIDKRYMDHNSFLHERVEYLSRMGLFSDNPIDVDKIMDGVSVMDLSRLKTQEQKRVHALAMLKLVSSRMYRSKPSNKIRSIIVLDEAWKVLEGSKEINKFFRESRKFGFGLLISSQLAVDINNEIMGNSACFFIFRLQGEQDIGALIGAGIISEEDPTKLKRGNCIMSVSLKASNSAKRFIVEKTDNFNTDMYKMKCGSMMVSISKDLFSKIISGTGIDRLKQSRIELFADQNERNIDLKAMIMCMKDTGLSRPTIISALSQMGIDDLDIIAAYESSKEVVIDEE